MGDVAGLIEAEGYDSAHEVGHNWGGAVGFATGLRRPERIPGFGPLVHAEFEERTADDVTAFPSR